jgi:hypothetical protein
MTKQLLITLAGSALAAAALYAQTPPLGNAFQHSGSFGLPGATPMRIEGAQIGPVVARPFSATEVRRTVQTLSDGTHVNHADTTRFYRDAQGRMRAESPNRVEIFDPVSGLEHDLNPESKTYKTSAIPDKTASMSLAVVGSTSSTSFSTDSPDGDLAARHARSQARRSPTPPVTEDLAPQLINGLSAKGSRITTTIPVGAFGNDREVQVVNERWYSDDLKVLVKSSNSDPRFGVTTYELIDIAQGAPDPALFQVPPDYTQKGNPQLYR